MNKSYLIFGLIILLCVNFTSAFIIKDNYVFKIQQNTFNGWCFQETANVSTVCGGLNTGNYYGSSNWSASFPFSNTIDENYTSFGNDNSTLSTNIAYGFVNYSVPIGATNNSLWMIKYGNTSSTTYTINLSISNCFQNPLQLQYRSYGFGTYNTSFYCKNTTGTNYILLVNNYNVGSYGYQVYEESMWWDMIDNNFKIKI